MKNHPQNPVTSRIKMHALCAEPVCSYRPRMYVYAQIDGFLGFLCALELTHGCFVD
jgi:hypothetical protein